MMMEGSDNWILRLQVEWFFLCFFILVRSTCGQQEEFVSLACCADSNFPDQSTTINWKPDDSWFPNRTGCLYVKEALRKYEGYAKARIFNIYSGKRCYRLKSTKEQDYLVRGTFLFGDSLRTTLETYFDVLVGVTVISRVSSLEDSEVEGIFRATKDYIDFCLGKVQGDPYISKLELRPLQNLNYLQGFPSTTVLKSFRRIDVGNTGRDIRYPLDKSDRIWKPDTNSMADGSILFVNVSSYSANNVTPPLDVLQAALYHSERLEFQESLDQRDYEYRVLLYFFDNGTSKPGDRVLDIYINNEKVKGNFDILANGSNYKEVVMDVRANGSLNLSLIKASGSLFGPICNAYEILQVQEINQSYGEFDLQVQQTDEKDVEVAWWVRNELLVSNQANEVLESWSGDPCLPKPWKGLACAPSNGSAIITSLNLSSTNLQGSIPLNITQLANIETLNLSYNHFNGSIPEFPYFSMLISVDISHNSLAGSLPESLISLPHLQSLYFGCNPYLDKDLQSRFNSTIRTDNGRCDSNASTHTPLHVSVIATVACGSFLFTVTVGIIFVCIYRRKSMSGGRFDGKGHQLTNNVFIIHSIKDDVSIKSITIEKFTLEYLETVTENYKTLIGEGGFGSVYRGILSDGQEVAVKVWSATSTQGTREFDNEVRLLSQIRHENLVPLLGHCSQNDQQILVYPFMSNGSLQDRLYGEPAKRKTLDWPTRLSIALGAARGLMSLHTFPEGCIIHRDVKSSNILLDHSMSAKVADFGFSKYAPQEGDSCASLEVRGTAGYLDPEYYLTQRLSDKSDVFSFGVVLLEIVTGQEPLNIHRPRNEWSLVEWAKPYIRDSKIDEIVDPSIKGGYLAEAMWRVVEVALTCIEPYAAYRPSMVDILRELDEALIIETNASEYMRSIDSMGTSSNRFSIVMEKNIAVPTNSSSPSKPSPLMPQCPSPPRPR